MTQVLSLWRGILDALPRVGSSSIVLAQTARAYGVTPEQLIGPGLDADLVVARQAAMWALRQIKRPSGEPQLSLYQIGKRLGGRHHTTVRHGIARHAERLEEWGLL